MSSKTRPQWSEGIVSDLGAFLADHARCERKASATALSLIHKYPNRPDMHETLAALAVEELEHYRQVLEKLRERKLPPPTDEPDPYAVALHRLIRHGREEDTLCDRLLIAALIESRSHERLKIAAGVLQNIDLDLSKWYRRLARAESRHQALFVDLAVGQLGASVVEARLVTLLTREAEIADNLPLTARVH